MTNQLRITGDFDQELVLTAWHAGSGTIARLTIRGTDSDPDDATDYIAEIDIPAADVMPLATALAGIANPDLIRMKENQQ